MKILQVMAGGKHGGAETAFVDMCIALHEAGEVVEVVTRANDVRVPVLEAAGLRVHSLPFAGRGDVFTRWRLRRIIKVFAPDIVQCWMARASSFVPRWTPSMGVPRYLNVSRLGGYYKLKYFRSMDYFVTITPDIRRYLMDAGLDGEKILHINNFAETEEVQESISRASLGVPDGVPLLLALGRLHESKAFDVLIRAVAALEAERVHVCIAGEGPQRSELEALIEALDVGDRVHLLGWRSDRAALLQACDICVFPSRYEPFGTVFVQAWAQRVPLITSAADGPRQFVRDGEDGLVVPIDDVEALQGAVVRLLGDPDLCTSLVEHGYARYEGEFTRGKSVQAYLRWYHDMRVREGL